MPSLAADGTPPKWRMELRGTRREQRHGSKGGYLLVAAHRRRSGTGTLSTECVTLLDRSPRHAYGGVQRRRMSRRNGCDSGTELCAVAEYMYSLECLGQCARRIPRFGGPTRDDRIQCAPRHVFPRHVGPPVRSTGESDRMQCPGEPAVEHQRAGRECLRPRTKLRLLHGQPEPGVAETRGHLWMRTQAGGIASVAYAPSRRSNRSVRGTGLSVELRTDYPFRHVLEFTVRVGQFDPLSLCLLRIPAWADGATLEIDGKRSPVREVGAFHTIERSWREETTVLLSLPMRPRSIPRPHNAISIYRGPLLYALRIGEEWRQINKEESVPRIAAWGLGGAAPTTPWNYALELEATTLVEGITFADLPIEAPVFSPKTPPITATVTGRRVPAWTEQEADRPAQLP